MVTSLWGTRSQGRKRTTSSVTTAGSIQLIWMSYEDKWSQTKLSLIRGGVWWQTCSFHKSPFLQKECHTTFVVSEVIRSWRSLVAAVELLETDKVILSKLSVYHIELSQSWFLIWSHIEHNKSPVVAFDLNWNNKHDRYLATSNCLELLQTLIWGRDFSMYMLLSKVWVSLSMLLWPAVYHHLH